MVIFIDGPQLTGKSSLIEYLKKEYNYKDYKFEFSKFSKLFNIKKKKDLKNYQLGKDLSLTYILNSLTKDKDKILIDRGVMSSIYYSLLLKRMKYKEVIKLLDIIKEYKNLKFVFIISKNKNINLKRNKKDGFDKLSKKQDFEILRLMIRLCKERNINFNIFYNDFSKNIEYNGKVLKEVLR